MNIFKIENYKKLFSKCPFKIILSYNIIPILISSNDPILRLISTFSEIEKILEITGSEITKFLYYHMKNIHNILYESEEIITLSTNNNNNFEYYFYLNLLINENLCFVYYNYSIETILHLYNLQIDNSKYYKEFIKLKIIINLINYFKQFDDYDEDKYNDKLSQLENDCKNKITDIIQNQNNIIKESILKLNIKKGMTVNDFYKKAIIELIKIDKYDNYEYIYNIIEELDLEYIDIIKIIFEELLTILNNNEMYIKNYLISDTNDLSNIKKINFNYILLKYILKDPIYIYQIPCLLKTRNNIIKIIKNDLEKVIFLNVDKNIKLRIKFIIEIIDSKYYFLKYIKNILKEILNYYKHFLSESKKEDIVLLENEIKKNKTIEYEKYLSDLNIAKKLNKREFIIKHIFNKKKQSLEKDLNEDVNFWEGFENKIKEEKYNEITGDNETKQICIDFFKDENNKDSLLNIFEYNTYNSFIDYISSRSNYPPSSLLSNLNNIKQYSERETENDYKDSLSNKNNKAKDNDKNIDLSYKFLELLNSDILNNKIDNNSDKKTGEKENKKKRKLIEYVREINNELFLFGGLNKPINIYNIDFIYKFSIDKLTDSDWIYNTLVLKSNIDKEIKLVCCCINCIYLSTLSISDNIINNPKHIQAKYPTLFCLEIQKNQTDFIIFNEKEVRRYGELFSKIVQMSNGPIDTGRVRSGVWIEENIFGFCTIDNVFNNKNKKNKVIIYNVNSNRKKNEIPINYTINLSQNSLASMRMTTCENKKVLLFGCKKYVKRQKNGILIVNYSFSNEKDVDKVYFEKTNFEVYCFCQISKYKDENKIFHIKNKIEKTDYFLVGGLDINKNRGVIKLYKLICVKDNNSNDTIKIKYIDEAFIYEKKYYKYFRGAISCMIQLEGNNKILVGCWDGNVYIFNPPRIDLYENLDDIDLK